ncbi:unnamed protein product [Didymodactylos carnosus]|uniref:Uncharacterized protein n=1 Tax=Didymodactylos carnosus TaxID=1234261 RepID=A0A813SY39_9BILA|nr:unnamed protein product [Didymodactylos carnosus]CAF3585999.1 unnamed protein product [Didymodactylos carnosus]
MRYLPESHLERKTNDRRINLRMTHFQPEDGVVVEDDDELFEFVANITARIIPTTIKSNVAPIAKHKHLRLLQPRHKLG